MNTYCSYLTSNRLKHIICLLFVLTFGLVFSQKKDTRSLEQINDSILKEAQLIHRYDKAFTMAMTSVEDNRSLRKNAGEILVIPKNKQLMAVIFAEKSNTQILGEMTFDAYIDTAALITVTRPASDVEMDLLAIKHKMMNEVQNEYDVVYGDGETYLNPIFIPFTEKIRGKKIKLYKLYLTTETNQANTIPFGRDYMFIAKENGSIFYNLQFNEYIPVSISEEIAETQLVTIEYPDREPYITPTDIYLFIKYGIPKDLLDFRVKSNDLGIFFDYNWDRETLDAVLE